MGRHSARHLLVLFLLSGLAAADEPILRLPKETGWARYHASTKPEGGEELTAVLTLKALSRPIIDGKPHRWLESEYLNEQLKVRERTKYLISERHLETSLRPTRDFAKVFTQNNDDPVTEEGPGNRGFLPTDFLYFPGLLKQAKLVDDARTISHQRGTWEIPQAYVGTYRWWRPDREPETTAQFVSEFRVWMHPELPVGYAHAQLKLRNVYQGQERRTWDLEFSLQEFGERADVAIPDE